MRETFAKARSIKLYMGHAREHEKRIRADFPRVKARAEAQKRGDPAEGGKTGCIKRLKQFERQLEQYDAEFRLYKDMTRNLEPEEVMVDFVLKDAQAEASGEEVDRG